MNLTSYSQVNESFLDIRYKNSSDVKILELIRLYHMMEVNYKNTINN